MSRAPGGRLSGGLFFVDGIVLHRAGMIAFAALARAVLTPFVVFLFLSAVVVNR